MEKIITAANLWIGQDLRIANTEQEIIEYFQKRVRPMIYGSIKIVDAETAAKVLFLTSMTDEDLAEKINEGYIVMNPLWKGIKS